MIDEQPETVAPPEPDEREVPRLETRPRPRLHSMVNLLGSTRADADPMAAISDAAQRAALRRSEARRDAVSCVALAIKRRGEDPVTGWTTKDIDTAYSIGDMLIALESSFSKGL